MSGRHRWRGWGAGGEQWLVHPVIDYRRRGRHRPENVGPSWFEIEQDMIAQADREDAQHGRG